MGRVISLHEYELRAGVDGRAFEAALQTAEGRELFRIPGLQEHLFLRGVKGARRGAYAALWIYHSRAAWEKLWGPPEDPRPRSRDPAGWRAWEDEILKRFLVAAPEQVHFTAYEELFR
jgi:hypothetical protein